MRRALDHLKHFAAVVISCVSCAGSLIAQDMSMSDVLIDGQGWTVVAQGFSFTDSAATDAEGNFYFTDVKAGDVVNKLAPDGKLSVYASGVPRISGLQLAPDGRLIACQGGQPGKILAISSKGEVEVLADNVQPNDLVVAKSGGIYFTETGKSQVTYIAPGHAPVKAGTGPAKPNGITLSADQETLAVSDYGGENVWVWRIAKDGSLEFSQPYMTMRLPAPEQPSKGDGMTIDATGRYYVTSAVGIQIFDPTGRLGGVILPPLAGPMVSVEFSGPELGYLFVCCGDKVFRRQVKVRGLAQ